MAWIWLFIAGFFEVAWVVCLKYSHGFTRLFPTILTFFFMLGSFLLLAHAMKTLLMGTSYAVWTGIGVIGATVMGIILFGEPVTISRVIFILMIAAGIAGLKLVG